jgi:DNA-binding FrmR family transcriptional regulator
MMVMGVRVMDVLSDIFLWIGCELLPATLAAKEIGFCGMFSMKLGRGRIDRHTANRVFGCARMRRLMVGAMPPAAAGIVSHKLSPLLAKHTPWGYIESMRDDIKLSVRKKLNRIEGQVRGVAKMIDKDRYCIDVINQIDAVQAALKRVENDILHDHVAHCVEGAISSGNKADQRRKVTELMDLLGRTSR